MNEPTDTYVSRNTSVDVFCFPKALVNTRRRLRMDKKPYKEKKCRPPDLDKFIKPEWKHYYVSYAQGAKMYSLNYWPFVRLAKEAGASWALRKTAVVDLFILDDYMI